MKNMKIEEIARLAHNINKAYCAALGDFSQKDWEDAPDWQKSSAIKGVEFHMENPDALPSHSHECWLEEKRMNGWKYGPVKDEDKKEHPCFVPYDELPQDQKIKDYLFKAVIDSCR